MTSKASRGAVTQPGPSCLAVAGFCLICSRFHGLPDTIQTHPVAETRATHGLLALCYMFADEHLPIGGR